MKPTIDGNIENPENPGNSWRGNGATAQAARYDEVRHIMSNQSSYENTLRDMYKQRLSDFNSHTQPMIDQLQEDARSTKAYDRAVDRADGLAARVESVAKRQESYTMSGMLPSQRAAAKHSRTLATSTSGNAMVTAGSAQARENRTFARNQLMGISEQLQQSGSASMSQVVQQQQQRDQANRQAKQGTMSQVGAVVGAGIGFMAGGGPMGASVGASIGAAAGGYIGG